MSVNELKAKYGRIANDPSQLEMFKDDVIEGKTTGFPELPEGAEGKALVLQMQDGELSWKDASPVVRKGDVIKLAGEDYRVLSVNEDMTDCEVMHIGPVTITKFRDSGTEYEGSNVDQACETFYEGLPDEIKDAIIEQEVVQYTYNLNAASGTEDFAIDNTATGGLIYRFKKTNNEPVVVGARHAYAPSSEAIKNYFGGTSTTGVNVLNVFPLYTIFCDANIIDVDASMNVMLGSVLMYRRFVNPTFHINLTLVNL